MKLTRWSSTYSIYIEGDTRWVRADHAERMRAGLVRRGYTETGETVVTGGQTYYAFVPA